MKPLAQIHTSAALRLKRFVINPDGSVAKESPWVKNLILDQGLNDVAAGVWAAMTTYCHIGTGTNPFQRDSGTTTVSVTALVATASVGYFEAGDVGRLLKLDSGEEYYISGFTSTTQVSLLAGPDAAASEATIWYVNRTTLQTETQRTSTVRTQSGDNGRTYDGALQRFTYRRTHLFPAEVGAITYQEIGWGRPNTTALFSGLVLSGGGDSLTAGQQYMVISELILTPSPTTTVASPDVGVGGWNSEGDCNIESFWGNTANNAWAYLNTSGGFSAQGGMEPSVASAAVAYLNNLTLQSPMTASLVGAPAGTVDKAASLVGYTTGNFYRDKTATFEVTEANGTWYGVGFGGDFANRTFSVKFDTPQTKDAVHRVIAVFRFSWGRTLVN